VASRRARRARARRRPTRAASRRRRAVERGRVEPRSPVGGGMGGARPARLHRGLRAGRARLRARARDDRPRRGRLRTALGDALCLHRLHPRRLSGVRDRALRGTRPGRAVGDDLAGARAPGPGDESARLPARHDHAAHADLPLQPPELRLRRHRHRVRRLRAHLVALHAARHRGAHHRGRRARRRRVEHPAAPAVARAGGCGADPPVAPAAVAAGQEPGARRPRQAGC
jgi:hypothetical protein